VTSVPRIQRQVPKGNVTQYEKPVPVIATLHWLSLSTAIDEDVRAWAIASTADAVRVVWAGDDGDRADWIPAEHVRHPGEPRVLDTFPRIGDQLEYISLDDSRRPRPGFPTAAMYDRHSAGLTL
jgi:hypothetical protein